ncbi:MAG: hypothetical protein IKM53_02345 [Clostridia bacterium]|nr:hypothetical protein [Clostridia bacterium]
MRINAVKKIIAFFVMLACVVSVCGCKQEETKETYDTAKNQIGGYTFEYPDYYEIVYEGSSTYITVGGTTGRAESARVSVEVRDAENVTDLKAFWNNCKNGLSTSLRELELVKEEFDKKVGGEDGTDAVRVEYFAKFNGAPVLQIKDSGDDVTYRFIQYFTLVEKKIFTFTYVSVNNYDGLSSIEKAVDSFETFESEYTAPEPEAGENGLLHAENSKGDFSFDYSSDWVLEREEAYTVISKGKASISVIVSALSDTTMGAGNYWDAEKAKLEEGFSDFSFVEQEEILLDGVKALKVQYKLTLTDKAYNFVQVYSVKSGLIYTVTLTANDEDLNMANLGLNTLIDTFEFE